MTLYKYLPSQYADPFLREGTVLFRSLLYFLACEDARRDELEGTHVYAPVSGLDVTNRTQRTRVRMPGWSMHSSVKHPEHLFVFCTSGRLTIDLARKFGCDACVEIGDVGKFVARLRTALKRQPQVKLATLRHGDVEYYQTALPPQEVWALPDRIVMNKPHNPFSEEEEHRFVFSRKADAFAFENVDMKLMNGPAPRVPQGDYPFMLVKLGTMADCCRVHMF